MWFRRHQTPRNGTSCSAYSEQLLGWAWLFTNPTQNIKLPRKPKFVLTKLRSSPWFSSLQSVVVIFFALNSWICKLCAVYLVMSGSSIQYLSRIPASPPPDGVVSNFSHPASQERTLTVVNAIFVPLMVCAVAIRIYTRRFLSGSLGWDDCKVSNPVDCSKFDKDKFSVFWQWWEMILIDLQGARLQKVYPFAYSWDHARIWAWNCIVCCGHLSDVSHMIHNNILVLSQGLGVHMWDIPAIKITKKVAHVMYPHQTDLEITTNMPLS